MNGEVEFKEGEFKGYQSQVPKPGFGSQLMMRLSGGLIKNEKQANSALLGLVAVAIIISLFLICGGRPSSPPPPDQLIKIAGPEGER